MNKLYSLTTRRQALSRWFLGGLGVALWGRSIHAASSRLLPTPAVSVGPFYPPDPIGLPFFRAKALTPLPQSNDLTNGPNGRHSEGDMFNLRGQVLSTTGASISKALVEIWQVDARGHYAVEVNADHDPGFAGYGRCIADAEGRYSFKTIRPKGYARYGGLIKRAAHLHVRVNAAGIAPLTSEIWFDGSPGNADDSFISRVTQEELRQRMLVQLTSVSGDVPAALFNIVLEE